MLVDGSFNQGNAKATVAVAVKNNMGTQVLRHAIEILAMLAFQTEVLAF